MATTRVSGNIAGTPVKQARFAVTADNDVLFTADSKMLVLGFISHSGVTALNVDAGVDILLTAFPLELQDGEDLCVTTAGAGEVSVFYIDEPDPGYDTFSV